MSNLLISDLKIHNFPLTVCIPVFNNSELFKYSLISLLEASRHLQQSNGKIIDLLVVDDSSEEDVKSIFDDALHSVPYESARFIRNPQNLGRRLNYEENIKRSFGKFVWVIGSDDFVYKQALVKLTEIIENNLDVKTFVLNISIYKINIQELRKYQIDKQNLSAYIEKQGVIYTNAPITDSKTDMLMDYVAEKYHNVYLGAVMTTVVSKDLMIQSFDQNRRLSINDAFYLVYDWYYNTYHLSMSFLDKPAYYISSPLVIAGDGARDWTKDKKGGIWGSDYLLIVFRVVPEIVELHFSNGLNKTEYEKSMNSVSMNIGMFTIPILFFSLFTSKLKYSFKEINYFYRITQSLKYKGYYYGFLILVNKSKKAIIKLIKESC